MKTIKKRFALLILITLIIVSMVGLTIWSINHDQPKTSELETTKTSYIDEFGREVITTSYVDKNGRVTLAADKGYAIYRQTKVDGQSVLEEYLDESGAHVLLSSGYAAVKRDYEDGVNTRIIYLDTTGAPVVINDGYSIIHRTFNDQRLADTDTYWIGEQQVERTQGYWSLHRFYNDKKQLVRQEYRGQNGELVINSSGYAILIRTYNEAGKVETERYYGIDEQPVARSMGQYGYSRSYDEKGRTVSTTYLGADGKPANTSRGYATVKNEYMPEGTKSLYYDVDNNPVTIGRNQYGVLRSDDQRVLLNEEGEALLRIDNFLSPRPYAVLILGIALAIIAVAIRGNKVQIAFLVCYLIFIALMTIAWRKTGSVIKRNYELFSSYRLFFSNKGTRQQILYNVWLFVPLGAIFAGIFRLKFSGPQSFLLAVLACALVSCTIELIQLVGGLGLFEFDDMVSNGLGGLIGAGVACVVRGNKNFR